MEKITGEHDDQFPDTLTVNRVKTVDRDSYSNKTVETVEFVYSVDDYDVDREYTISGVRIGCPRCKANSIARLDPDGKYYCGCGYSHEITRSMLFYHGTRIAGQWIS